MKKLAALTAVLVFFVAASPAAERTVIRILVFRGAWPVDHPLLKEATVWTASSEPRLASLRGKAAGPESVDKAALVETLIDAFDFESLEDVFAFAKEWSGSGRVIEDRILHGLGVFEFSLKARRVGPDSIELTAIVKKSKNRLLREGESMEKDMAKAVEAAAHAGDMETILDRTVALTENDPMIVGVPEAGGAFFLAFLTRSEEASPTAKGPESKASEIVANPKPVHQVVPAYPEDLQRQGIKGQVGILVAVDEEGRVAGLKVTKSLHPYLDYAAVQALRQWTYEPVLEGGKPVPVTIEVDVNFDPEAYGAEEKAAAEAGLAETDPAAKAELQRILDGGSEYCRRLLGAALDFVCEETIKEVHFNFNLEQKWAGIAVQSKGGGPVMTTWFPTRDPARTEKNSFVSEYMFVKKGEEVEERRILLKENGRKTADRTRLLEEPRFTILVPMFAPARLLEEGRRGLFYYRILEEDRIKGRRAYVLEATPKSGSENGVEYAKIWVDRSTFQILRSKIEGVPLEGFEDVLVESSAFLIKPSFTTTYVYDVEQKGVLFPSQLEIRVLYPVEGGPMMLMPRTVKWKADLAYDKYRFFTVETDSKVIK